MTHISDIIQGHDDVFFQRANQSSDYLPLTLGRANHNMDSNPIKIGSCAWSSGKIAIAKRGLGS